MNLAEGTGFRVGLTRHEGKYSGKDLANEGPGQEGVLWPRHPFALLQIGVQAQAIVRVQEGVGVS